MPPARKSKSTPPKKRVVKAGTLTAALTSSLKEMVQIYWTECDDGFRPAPACIIRAAKAIWLVEPEYKVVGA